MLKLNLENLLFSKGFLDLKYKTKKTEAIKSIQNRFENKKLEFLNLDQLVDVDKINNFVDKNKNDYENVVVLGIGGSTLGTKAIMQALKGNYYNELSRKKRLNNPRLYILDNIDPSELQNFLDNIKLKETLFIVISKSGSTIETISLYQFFKNKILEKYDSKDKNKIVKKHFVIIAGENSNFKKQNLKEGLEVFDIPEGIGGRFSVFTPVGLLPLAFIGIDINKILYTIKEYKKIVLTDSTDTNIALLTAIINFHSHIELGKNILVLFPYSSNLYYFGEWYKQLLAESLGKGGLGLTPNTAIGVTDQHSQLQLYYDGPNDKVLNFIEINDFGIDFDIIKDKFSFKQLLNAEKYGTIKSITDYNKINYTVEIEKLDEQNLAELILMYETQIVIMSEFFGVNAFDQPGVEIGKNIAKQKIKQNIGPLDYLEKNNNRNIVFIGGGNGQSSILKLFKEYTKKIKETNPINYNITSIVAMSDDGRTTGKLMKLFEDNLNKHLPPPGDLRRILFVLSNSRNKDFFQIIFEKVFESENKISDFTIVELFQCIIKQILKEDKIVDLKKDLEDFINNKGEIYKILNSISPDILDYRLNLNEEIKGHKFGNILMASLFEYFGNYEEMIGFLKNLLEVSDDVLPITVDKASIKAVLKNGEIIETQDKISNVANYNSAIDKLELMDNLKPKITKNIFENIKNADYIIIGPGDLFTSLIANFIVNGLTKVIEESNSKLIYILNSNNKKGETTNYKILDFVRVISKYLGTKKINYILGNNKIPELSVAQKEKFKNNISVKGGDYLILDKQEKQKILKNLENISIISGEYVNEKDLYKYNDKLIEDLIGILK